MLPQPSTYIAYAGERVLGKSKNGALVLSIDCIIDEQTSIVSYNYLTTNSGEINEKTVDNLKKVFGWNGADPFWLVETDLSQVPIEIVVEMDNYNGKQKPIVKWLNVPGSGNKMESADKQKIMAEFGGMFRATANNTPSQVPQRQAPTQNASPTPQQTPQQTAPPAQQQNNATYKTLAIPQNGVLPSTMEKAWQKLCTCMPDGTPRNELEAFWHKACALTGKPQASFTDMDWGGVESAINVYFDEVV